MPPEKNRIERISVFYYVDDGNGEDTWDNEEGREGHGDIELNYSNDPAKA